MDTNFWCHWDISYYVPIALKLVILKLIRLEWPTLELFVPGKTQCPFMFWPKLHCILCPTFPQKFLADLLCNDLLFKATLFSDSFFCMVSQSVKLFCENYSFLNMVVYNLKSCCFAELIVSLLNPIDTFITYISFIVLYPYYIFRGLGVCNCLKIERENGFLQQTSSLEESMKIMQSET